MSRQSVAREGDSRRDHVQAVGSRGGMSFSRHPLCRQDVNAQLARYEDDVKQAFDAIVPVLKQVSAIQHEQD
ncbi:MAG: carboxysome shell carbonic anhydrase, partial [Gammaproteobacteria bacterium]